MYSSAVGVAFLRQSGATAQPLDRCLLFTDALLVNIAADVVTDIGSWSTSFRPSTSARVQSQPAVTEPYSTLRGLFLK